MVFFTCPFTLALTTQLSIPEGVKCESVDGNGRVSIPFITVFYSSESSNDGIWVTQVFEYVFVNVCPSASYILCKITMIVFLL